jgi:hypothetical protein
MAMIQVGMDGKGMRILESPLFYMDEKLFDGG